MTDPTRSSIEAELLAWMRERQWRADEPRFERLALALFRYQAQRCASYRALLEHRGVDPARVTNWREIPAVPTSAFKELEIRSFPASETVHVFRTSGTSDARKGSLFLDTLALYDASLRPSFRRGLLPDLEPGARIAIRALSPSAEEAPDSSLSHMFRAAIEEWGNERSSFDLVGGSLQSERLARELAEGATPVLLCGTAFAFVHWLDELAKHETKLPLPAGSRVMETGGFKGRSRSVPRSELYGELSTRLGIPSDRIVNQYGMTELGSQFYDSVLIDSGPRRKLEPPWARVRIVDPDSHREVPIGEVGVIEVVDLANTGSVSALRTADLGRRVSECKKQPGAGAGFEVLGRAAEAELRGCSVAADAMLA